jgi:hypothetical protein
VALCACLVTTRPVTSATLIRNLPAPVGFCVCLHLRLRPCHYQNFRTAGDTLHQRLPRYLPGPKLRLPSYVPPGCRPPMSSMHTSGACHLVVGCEPEGVDAVDEACPPTSVPLPSPPGMPPLSSCGREARPTEAILSNRIAILSNSIAILLDRIAILLDRIAILLDRIAILKLFVLLE